MPIKVVLQDGVPEAICDTPEEAARLFAEFAATTAKSSPPAPPQKIVAPATIEPRQAGDEASRFAAMVAELNEGAQALLARLYSHGGRPVVSSDFAKELGVPLDKLGGVMGSVSKRCKNHRLPYNGVIVSEQKADGSRRFTEMRAEYLLLKYGGKLLGDMTAAVA